MPAKRSNLATALSEPQCLLPRATLNVGVKTPSFETAFPKPAVMINEETATSFMKPMMAEPTVRNAKEDISGTVVKSDSDATGYKPQPKLKSLGTSPSDTKSEIESILADLGFVMKSDVEAIFENNLTKRNTMQQLRIVKAVGSTFEDTLQESYFNSNNGLNSAYIQRRRASAG